MLTSKISETKSQDVRIKPRLRFSKSLWGIRTGTLKCPAVTGSSVHALNEVSLTTMVKTGPLTQVDSAKHNPSSTCLLPSVQEQLDSGVHSAWGKPQAELRPTGTWRWMEFYHLRSQFKGQKKSQSHAPDLFIFFTQIWIHKGQHFKLSIAEHSHAERGYYGREKQSIWL